MTDSTPRPAYEPFPVALHQNAWRSSVDERLRRRLPRRAYLPMLGCYQGLRKLAGRNPGRGRMLPDFVIIGAAKAGTTSLYAWLCAHPYVAQARAKEIHYFSFYHYRGADWYRQHFPREDVRAAFAAEHGRPFIAGEASPSYMLDRSAPQLMAKLIPDVKLIVSLRDPVERAYSQFHMRRREGEEPVESFLAAVSLEDERVDGGSARARAAARSDGGLDTIRTYLMRSRYAEQLERWLAHFPREQFHLLTLEELAGDPRATLERVHMFLGLPAQSPEHLEAHFTQHYDALDQDARDRLNEYFRPHNERLYELLGRDFGWGG